MVRISTAKKHNYRCPSCGGELKQDNAGRGYVSHVSKSNCQFERGEKDELDTSLTSRRIPCPFVSDNESSDGVRVFGYSERGIINTLLYEIGFSDDPIGALTGLLSLVHIPGSALNISGLLGAEVLVEQSLSDFGDADVILLLRGSDWRKVVFIEGKVKPSQTRSWTALGAWRRFLARNNNMLDSSNLFTQMYHKARFIAALKDGGVDEVEKGVLFPKCSTKTLRKLGGNPVVRCAAQMIEAYAKESYFVAAVPDTVSNLSAFYSKELKDGPLPDVTGWDIDGWGYISWEQVETYCRKHNLDNTLRVFDFNRGQIYDRAP
jgi:hypothetical protein